MTPQKDSHLKPMHTEKLGAKIELLDGSTFGFYS